MKVGSKTFKVHLDGYNITRRARRQDRPARATSSSTSTTTASSSACATTSGRSSSPSSRAHGAAVWRQPFTTLRAPKIFNLRSDPFEIGDHEGMDWNRWWVEHIFLLVPAQQYVGTVHRHVPGVSAQPEGRLFRARCRSAVTADTGQERLIGDDMGKVQTYGRPSSATSGAIKNDGEHSWGSRSWSPSFAGPGDRTCGIRSDGSRRGAERRIRRRRRGSRARMTSRRSERSCRTPSRTCGRSSRSSTSTSRTET